MNNISILNPQSSSEGSILSLVSARLKSARSRCWSTSYASCTAPTCLRCSHIEQFYCCAADDVQVNVCCSFFPGEKISRWRLPRRKAWFSLQRQKLPLSSCCYPAVNSHRDVGRDGGGEEAGQEPVHQAVREAEDPSGGEGDVVEQGERGGEQQRGGGGQRHPHQAANPQELPQCEQANQWEETDKW